jgi:dimethylaniline monooxygenase (N-oxide forming)
MLSFLESYAEHYNLLPKIRFNTVVTAVNLAPASASQTEGACFVIKYRQRDDNSGNDSTMIVDRLIVATGVVSQYNIPTIDGIEHFKGETLHSGNFRTSVIVPQWLQHTTLTFLLL